MKKKIGFLLLILLTGTCVIICLSYISLIKLPVLEKFETTKAMANESSGLSEEPPEHMIQQIKKQSFHKFEVETEDTKALVNFMHGYMEVTAYGFQKINDNLADAREYAEKIAEAKAYARMAAVIKEITVNRSLGIVDLGIESSGIQNNYREIIDEISLDLKKVIVKNAWRVHDENIPDFKKIDNGKTMQATYILGCFINGPKGFAKALYENPKLVKAVTSKDRKFTPPASSKKNNGAYVKKQETEKKGMPYTGLIVDARNISGILSSEFPKIYVEKTNEVVFNIEVMSLEALIENGSARYAPTINDARKLPLFPGEDNPLVGSNPLVIKALSSYDANPVISEEDAKKIFNAEYLKKGKVMIVGS